MCELNRCPYEEDEHMQCEWCPHDVQTEDEDFDDFEDFDD